jgi:hypothetical protein
MSTSVPVSEKVKTPASKAERDSDKSAGQVLSETSFYRGVCAEFIGTTLFVYIGTGIIIPFSFTPEVLPLPMGLQELEAE